MRATLEDQIAIYVFHAQAFTRVGAAVHFANIRDDEHETLIDILIEPWASVLLTPSPEDHFMSSKTGYSLAFVLAMVCQASAVAGELRAGAATANITPPLGEPIVGGWKALPANEVHDELHVRSIVIDDGAHQLAIAICDNVGIPREVFDVAKRRIETEASIPSVFQLMASTHTHSATSARGENVLKRDGKLNPYQQFVADRIVDSIAVARARLEPAQIGWGSVNDDTELFNRRWFVKEEEERRNPFGGVDQVRMNPGSASTLIRPAGPVDPEISFVSIRSADGRPMAVLANYSLHYVGGIPARVISADYFAVFAKELAGSLGVRDQYPPFVGILSNGTSGDVNNIDFAHRGPRRQPFEKMREVGKKVADRVHAALDAVQYRSELTVDARSSDLRLSVRKPDEALLTYMRAVRDRDDDEQTYHVHERTYAGRIEQLAESPAAVDVPLQVVRIGSLGIAAIPFEVFTETGLELKQRCPLDDMFTIELAGGSYGYLPTPPQHELGGYETWMGTNKVEKNASEKIVERLLAMFSELRPGR